MFHFETRCVCARVFAHAHLRRLAQRNRAFSRGRRSGLGPDWLNSRTELADFTTISNRSAAPGDQTLPGVNPDVERGGVGQSTSREKRSFPMFATTTSPSTSSTPNRRLAKRRTELFGATALLLLSLAASPSLAQGLQPGEAFATRFSGVAQGPGGLPAIDPQGTVGSILDLRAPGQPAQGQHWINEPQRAPITAAPNRPGVRRRVRRCHAAKHLRHHHRGVRSAPHRRQRAMDARHVR